MNEPQDFQHQLGTSWCSKPGACIPRQWKMSVGAGWSRSWHHLSVWLWWVWIVWYSRGHGAPREGVQASDSPRSSAKEAAVSTPVREDTEKHICSLWPGLTTHHVSTAQTQQGVSSLLHCRTSHVSAVASLIPRLAGWLFLAHYQWAQLWERAEISPCDCHCPGNGQPPSGFENQDCEQPLMELSAGCHHRRVLEPAHLNGDKVFEPSSMPVLRPVSWGPLQVFNVSAKMTSEWDEHGKSAHLIHIRNTYLDFTGIVETVRSLTSG